MRNHFLLSQDVTFLNHGSFGACPKPVFEKYQYWQRELERQPVQFMAEAVYKHLKSARDSLGNFIGCNGDDLFFVPNPRIVHFHPTNILSSLPSVFVSNPEYLVSSIDNNIPIVEEGVIPDNISSYLIVIEGDIFRSESVSEEKSIEIQTIPNKSDITILFFIYYFKMK